MEPETKLPPCVAIYPLQHSEIQITLDPFIEDEDFCCHISLFHLKGTGRHRSKDKTVGNLEGADTIGNWHKIVDQLKHTTITYGVTDDTYTATCPFWKEIKFTRIPDGDSAIEDLRIECREANKIILHLKRQVESQIGFVPVGAIVAFCSHLNGCTPDVHRFGFALCNGTTAASQGIPDAFITDTLPDLNSGRFLRGNNASGAIQSQDFKSFSMSGNNVGNCVGYVHNVTVPKSYASDAFFMGKWDGSAANGVTVTWDDSEVRPSNMSVIWIMRVK